MFINETFIKNTIIPAILYDDAFANLPDMYKFLLETDSIVENWGITEPENFSLDKNSVNVYRYAATTHITSGLTFGKSMSMFQESKMWLMPNANWKYRIVRKTKEHFIVEILYVPYYEETGEHMNFDLKHMPLPPLLKQISNNQFTVDNNYWMKGFLKKELLKYKIVEFEQ